MGSQFTNSLDEGLSFPLGTLTAPPGSTGNQDLDDSLGVDLVYIGEQGGLQVDSTGDYRLVRGLENVRRSIMRRLTTSPGEYALDPTYGVGLPTFVKKKMTGDVLDTLKSRIEDQVAADRRVTSVTSVQLTPSVDQEARPYLLVYVEYQVLGRQVTPIQQKVFSR